VWIDVKNSHEPAFFRPLLTVFDREGISWTVTARDYAEVRDLLRLKGIPYSSVGGHYGSNLIAKGIGRLLFRNISLLKVVPRFRMALSHMSPESPIIGRLRGATTVAFADNDLPMLASRVALRFMDHLLVPEHLDPDRMIRQGARPGSVERYPGFKEDLYLSVFSPDPGFLDSLPLRDYVVLRPEASKAEYYPRGVKAASPELLRALDSEGIPVIYLPRYPEQRRLAEGLMNVYVPPVPLNGLDLCWHARAVLTGSGTMGREAARMGVPAVQFFPGANLSVDRALERDGTLLHSTDVRRIVRHVLESKRREFDRTRSQATLDWVSARLLGILRG
jgi:hypothetical protein